MYCNGNAWNMKLINDDCLKALPTIPDQSVDLVLTDPPYGTTACKWDSIIPFEPMWKELKRITKKNSAIIFTASQPFTSVLVMSNISMFKTSWIYQKRCASNFAQGKYMPMKEHEDVLIFGKNKTVYYPIMQERKGSGEGRVKYKFSKASTNRSSEFVGDYFVGNLKTGKGNETQSILRYPSSIQEFNNRACGDRGFHPTQKPVALLEYLIKTYSLKNDTVLDFTMGSGSTGVAAKNLNRNFIGIELDKNYFDIAKQRIEGTLI